MFAPVKVRERKSDSGTIGSETRRSTTTNAMNAASAIAPGHAMRSMSAYVVAPSAIVISSVPVQSIAPDSVASSRGSLRHTISSVAAAMGRLMKNTARHEIVCTR